MCPVSLVLQFWTCRSTETSARKNGIGRSAIAVKKKKKEEGELCYAVARSSCLKLSTDGRTSHRLPPNGKLPLLFDVVTLTRLSPIPSMPICPQPFPWFSPGPSFPLWFGWPEPALLIWLLTYWLFKLAEGHLLPSYLLASSQDQPWYLSCNHPIFTFGFCSFEDLGQHVLSLVFFGKVPKWPLLLWIHVFWSMMFIAMSLSDYP